MSSYEASMKLMIFFRRSVKWVVTVILKGICPETLATHLVTFGALELIWYLVRFFWTTL